MNLHDTLDVYVEINGESVRAGTLGASFNGIRALGGSWFEYDAGYHQAPGAYPLDPSLPLGRSRSYSGEDQQLFGAFQDLTPDDWGERVINANLQRLRSTGEEAPRSIGKFDYLTIASDEARLGAIRFQPSGGGQWLGPASVPSLSQKKLDAYSSAASRLEAHEATAEDIELLNAPGSSAGGARPKVTVRLDGKLKLLKLPSDRDSGRDGEAWEYLAITLAKNANISVQSAERLRVSGGKTSLALDRFDRTTDGSRLGFMSARTAMEIGDQEHGTITYLDLADATDSLTAGDRKQLRDLFKRVALTLLINNVDDHWKNHAFIRQGEGWTLSPAYDINPSPTRGVVLSRPVSSSDDPSDRDIRNLVSTADAYSLSAEATAQSLGEVLTAVREWATVARDIGISAGEIEVMKVAFSEDQQAHVERAIRKLGGRSIIDLGTDSPGDFQRSKESEESSGATWVSPHVRNGKPVAGFWRHTPRRE